MKKYLLYLKLFLVTMFFGGTFIAGKILSQVLPPFTSSFLRFSLAALFLLLFLGMSYPKNAIVAIDKKSIIQIFLLSLTGIVGYNFFFFSGLKFINASRASMIISLNPASISFFSFLFLGEKLNRLKVLGIMLSFFGALVVITNGQPGLLFSGNIGMGELYILGCVFCWTAFTLISKSVIKKIQPLVVIALACLAGAFILAIPAWQEGYLTQLFQLQLDAWISLLVLSLLGSVIAYIWYYEGLSAIGASRTGVFINFVPVWATAMAIIILNEQISASFVVGAVIVLSGVYLVNKPSKREKQ